MSAGIRLRFHCPEMRYWQQFNLKWVSATTGETRTSSVYPWLAPGESTTSFWIDDRVREAWIEPGSTTPGLDVVAVEIFSPAAQ